MRALLPLAPAALFFLATCGGSAPASHGGVPIDSWPAGATLGLTDHQQNVVASVDAAGELVAERAYHPYGILRASSGAELPRLFVGNERDDAAGLDDFHARPYRSSVARFLSLDPVVLQPADAAQAAHAAYAYTAGNPIDFSDPDGREKGMLSSSFARDTCIASGGCSQTEWEGYRDAARPRGDPHLALDIAGAFDPLGIADGLNSLLYTAEGDYADAAISAAAMLPLGELGKLGRVKKAMDGAGDLARVARSTSARAYSTAFETTLSPKSYPGISRARHFQEANAQLLKTMEASPEFAAQMGRLGINLERTATGLAPRTPPAGWTWHHEVEAGVMRLVPRVQHTPGSRFWDVLHPGGRGGYSIWGQQ